MSRRVRVRFAPSPTGGLHMGGVRTILFNYLFAKQNNGDFILRIEDTDQQRFVPGAEDYIYRCLQWIGLEADESPEKGGDYGPYRQSERKEKYLEFAEQLVKQGQAYYAFDTIEELEEMRTKYKSEQNPSPQYDHRVREKMKNSISLTADQVEKLKTSKPYTIRIKMPGNEKVNFTDLIRGEVSFDTSLIDDKVLIKADGMPTYHLAVVVDDYLMNISHAFRGEEWLPSSPVHILLWKYLFGLDNMPQWAHLPLILGPEGKLSKRDGSKYGFPVFAMSWTDHSTGDITEGFREIGFLPEAFLNFLALLGWNDGTDKEIFDKEELIRAFSIERVHSGGAHFDFEKAKWFNHEWIKKIDNSILISRVKTILEEKGLTDIKESYLKTIVPLVKERCTLLTDFYNQVYFFFQSPVTWDTQSIKSKWSEEKYTFFEQLIEQFRSLLNWDSASLENKFKELASEKKIKAGELQLPLRIMIVGGKFGPPVFQIAEVLGKPETLDRIQRALEEIRRN